MDCTWIAVLFPDLNHACSSYQFVAAKTSRKTDGSAEDSAIWQRRNCYEIKLVTGVGVSTGLGT